VNTVKRRVPYSSEKKITRNKRTTSMIPKVSQMIHPVVAKCDCEGKQEGDGVAAGVGGKGSWKKIGPRREGFTEGGKRHQSTGVHPPGGGGTPLLEKRGVVGSPPTRPAGGRGVGEGSQRKLLGLGNLTSEGETKRGKLSFRGGKEEGCCPLGGAGMPRGSRQRPKYQGGMWVNPSPNTQEL